MTTLPTTVQERIALPSTAQGAPSDAPGAYTAADIFAMIRRRMLLVVILAILFSAISVAGFWVWWQYLPSYEASAFIECVTNRPPTELSLEGGQQRLQNEEFERFVQTQAIRIKSPSVLLKALGMAAVQDTEWYRLIDKDARLIELTDDLRATPMRNSNFLRVSISCRNKKDPDKIVNAVVGAWQLANDEDMSREYGDRLTQARDQEKTVSEKILAKEEQLKSMQALLPPGVGTTGGAFNPNAQRVAQVTQLVVQMRITKSQLENLMHIYTAPGGAPITPDVRAALETDPQIQRLTQSVAILELQLTASRVTFGENHALIRQLKAQLETQEKELAEVTSAKLRAARLDMREMAITGYNMVTQVLFELMEELMEAEAALKDQDEKLFEYMQLQREIEEDRLFKNEVAGYVKSIERVVKERSGITVEVRQSAIEPWQRSAPTIFLLPIGVFFAIALAVGSAVGLEMLDKSVRTSQDIVRHLQIAMLGAVPDVDDEEIPIDRVETVTLDVPRSMVAEAFRRIRTNLQFSAPAANQRSILVTSPRPEDGKTTVAANLAIVAAQTGRRILLVDANFRRPGLHRLFSIESDQGLSNILISEATLDSCVAPTDLPALSVLPCGPIPPNPAELLGSEHFRRFLDDATAKYDQVIIDTPPVLLAGDAVVASTATDGVVLVVRANENSRGVAQRACTLLANVNARLFGCVLNAAQVTRGGYFRQQLREYYDYQEDADPRRAKPK